MRFLFSCHPQPLADDTSFTQSLRKRVEYLASSNSSKLSSLFQYSLENAYLFQFFARVSCPKVSILAGHRIGFQIKFDKAIFYGFDAFFSVRRVASVVRGDLQNVKTSVSDERRRSRH